MAVARYYEILIDTLLAIELPPYHRSIRKRQSQRSKYYLFDLGIKRALENSLGIPIVPSTYEYGRAFEHFFIVECTRPNYYFRTSYKFSYLRTKDNNEIDFIVEMPGKKHLAIEIKSSLRLDPDDFKLQVKLSEDVPRCEFMVSYLGDQSLKAKGIEILPWPLALKKIFPLSVMMS